MRCAIEIQEGMTEREREVPEADRIFLPGSESAALLPQRFPDLKVPAPGLGWCAELIAIELSVLRHR